ncbi:MAG TPA: hydantoinase/oxoprolinase family protein [Acidimicrobiia bacterium]|nr:hydantoinase/oxoprolinase family protein [Acidimicrobiia bacterium]
MTAAVVGADVGGTFTDCVAWSDGRLTVAKVPTTVEQSEGVVEGARRLFDGAVGEALLHGSTVATNALLERKGADTVLVTDEGFEDVLEIGRQDRPSLYDSFHDRPRPLVDRDDRLGVTGEVGDLAERISRRAPEAVAVSLAYSFRDPAAEEAVAAAVEPLGIPVALSHRVVGEFREYERTSTTVLNAYLWPRVAGYLERLAVSTGEVAERVQVMRSSGGLMEVDQAAGLAAALLLSGPAGGVVAAARMGQARGYGRLITLDMGGTSTDVCRIENARPEVAYERAVDGYVCRMPSVAVHTIGAGGGSVGWIDPGGSLRVGPRSAGAVPGPAAYGMGGTEATVTDAHIVLGRVDPAVRLAGSLPLDPEAALQALQELGRTADMSPNLVAAGMLEVVEAHMERAIRAVSIEQGADPRQAVLVAFGGAGGLHSSGLARRLGMKAVAIPPYAGVFSALGLLMAPPRLDGARSVLLEEGGDLAGAMASVVDEAVRRFRSANGVQPARVESLVDMRYRGQSHEITVTVAMPADFATATADFHRLHAEMNGFARLEDPVEAVTVRAVAEGRPLLGWDDLPPVGEGPPPTPRRRHVVFGQNRLPSDVWERATLPAGFEFAGPAVIEEEVGTTVLLPGDTAVVAADGTIEVRW